MNVLVIGGGSIGQRHLRNLLTVPGLTVEACTRNAAVGSTLGVRTYRALADAWESRPAAAIIANMTNEHVPTALAAAERRVPSVDRKAAVACPGGHRRAQGGAGSTEAGRAGRMQYEGASGVACGEARVG